MSYTKPPVLTKEFAYNGDKVPLPATADTDKANQETGYPLKQEQALDAGGLPMRRDETNGIFNFYTKLLAYMTQGGMFTFDPQVVTDNGGYAKGAVLIFIPTAGNPSLVVSLIDNNIANFVADPTKIDGVNWSFTSSIDFPDIDDNPTTGDITVGRRVNGSLTIDAVTAGINSIAIGKNTIPQSSTGSSNISLGINALTHNTAGTANIAIGHNALEFNNMGNNCIAIGRNALLHNVNGFNNIAIGDGALLTTIAGEDNIAIGISAGRVETGDKNIYIGTQAGFGSSGNSFNTILGYHAISNTDNYSSCTILGSNCLETFNNSNVSGQITCVGNDMEFSLNPLNVDQVTCIGANSGDNITNSFQIQLGAKTTATALYCTVNITTTSDLRDKIDIQDTQFGLDFINKLRPVDFRYNFRDSYKEKIKDEDGNVKVITHENDQSKSRSNFNHGLIAQELESVMKDFGIQFGGLDKHSTHDNTDSNYGITYTELIAPMIKAIQELSKEVQQLKLDLKKESPNV